MTDRPGLRERKKERTRRSLVEAALRLFEQRGYEETTVDQIATAADVSRRTFFSYFPAKEDVLFYGMRQRANLVLEGIRARPAHEPMIDVLVHAAEEVGRSPWGAEPLNEDLGRVGLRLIREVPALQARALYRLALAEAEIVEALRVAYPDGFDPIMAAAMVGAVVRAGTAAAMAAIRHGQSPPDARAAALRAVQVVGGGLRLDAARPATRCHQQ
ncbi:MAG: TetR family transcriptional regulator [Dactylosporangium sp.]|nr:TetR/AcrR family transcriptional regulator; helix-turn-helix transcriptional regulator [Dactylosporangium sp.]NNJ61496.1 TetR family transcriptional regulator [Dactylosporangium sp.]